MTHGHQALTLTVVIPSFNERDNVYPLVDQLNMTLAGLDAEILYVDDSTDDTPEVVREAARASRLPLNVLHRDLPSGGLAGAVTAGLERARGHYVIVMDADLQHPPTLVPRLLHTAVKTSSDIVVASRYLSDGDASGLSSTWRRSVSSLSTTLARACFPRRVGRVCSDPMTGFFCARREALDLPRLHPRGFKILLEILARHDLKVSEVPFEFGVREAGLSKASWMNGLQFLRQMASLRMGRMSRFATVGGIGTVLNLAVMSVLVHLLGVNYVVAAVVATEIAILHNFVMQERFVFRDLRSGEHNWFGRMIRSFAFNNAETALRVPILVALVGGLGLYPVVAQGLTLGAAFAARFFFVSRVIYRPRRGPRAVDLAVDPPAIQLEGRAA